MRPNAKWLRIMFSFLSLDSARAAVAIYPHPPSRGREERDNQHPRTHTSQLLLSGMAQGSILVILSKINTFQFQQVRFIDPSAGAGVERLDLTKSER